MKLVDFESLDNECYCGDADSEARRLVSNTGKNTAVGAVFTAETLISHFETSIEEMEKTDPPDEHTHRMRACIAELQKYDSNALFLIRV